MKTKTSALQKKSAQSPSKKRIAARPASMQNKKAIHIVNIDEKSSSPVNIAPGTENLIIIRELSGEIQINLGENSMTSCIEMQGTNVHMSPDASGKISSGKISIIVGKNAELSYFGLHCSGGNNSFSAELMNNSKLKVQKISILKNSEAKGDIKVTHLGENSKSELRSSAVLSDSKMHLNGLIKVEQKAEESEGFQKSDFLILKDSSAVSIPNLEILNNNVKCSHGSSISRIDAEKLFYLQSRGMDKNISMQMLISAFVSSALAELPASKAAEEMTEKIAEQIEKIAQ